MTELTDEVMFAAAVRAGYVRTAEWIAAHRKPGRPKRWLGSTSGRPVVVIGSGMSARVVVGRRHRFRPPLPNKGWRNDWMRQMVWYPRIGWVTDETIARQHRGGRTRRSRWQPAVPSVPIKPSRKARR